MKTEKINYRQEAKKARAQSGFLSLFALVMAYILFYALTDSFLRAGIALLALALSLAISSRISALTQAARIYDAQEHGKAFVDGFKDGLEKAAKAKRDSKPGENTVAKDL